MFKTKKTRILYLLPEAGDQGGMTAITKMYYETGLFKNINNRHFKTSYSTNSKFLRIFEGVILKIYFLKSIFLFKPRVIIVMTSSHWGFYDKCLYCLIANLFGIKSILNPVGGEFLKFYKKNKLNKFLVDILIQSASVVVIGSNYWFEYFKNNFDSKVLINKIPNPVASEKFIRQNFKYLKGGKMRVITVGSLIKSKGVFELAYIIKNPLFNTMNIEFHIVGTGDLLDWLRIELESEIETGLVILHGRVSDKEKINLLTSSDVFLSLSHFEVIPISILEAMSASLLIISSNVGGIPDLIEDGLNGYLVSLNNIEEVPLILSSLYSKQKSDVREMGFFSRQKIENNYDVNIIIDAYENLSRSLVNN